MKRLWPLLLCFLVGVLVGSVIVVAVSHVIAPTPARRYGTVASYGCSSLTRRPPETHCYGEMQQLASNYGQVGFTGASTTYTIGGLHVTNGQVLNTMWLTSGSYWVEAGYVYDVTNVYQRSLGEHIYWADSRPNGGGYHQHEGPTIPPTLYGGTMAAAIGAVNPTAFDFIVVLPKTWNVSVVGGGLSMFGQSTNNTFVPTRIDIGEELFGHGYVGVDEFASKALYSSNQYGTGAVGSNFQWHFFTQNGYVLADNPPYVGWNQGHTPSTYPSGGVEYTCGQASPC